MVNSLPTRKPKNREINNKRASNGQLNGLKHTLSLKHGRNEI